MLIVTLQEDGLCRTDEKLTTVINELPTASMDATLILDNTLLAITKLEMNQVPTIELETNQIATMEPETN